MGLSTSTIAFMQAESQDAASYIHQALYDFDTNNSVMSGHCTGVKTRVREFAPYAAYIHCYAHVLNLVLVDSVKSVTHAYEFFALLEALYICICVLFKNSCLIHEITATMQSWSATIRVTETIRDTLGVQICCC